MPEKVAIFVPILYGQNPFKKRNISWRKDWIGLSLRKIIAVATHAYILGGTEITVVGRLNNYWEIYLHP